MGGRGELGLTKLCQRLTPGFKSSDLGIQNMPIIVMHFQGITRVAKCHRYGRYIRVKKLEGWGKKSGRIQCFAKSRIVLSKFEQLL